MIIGISAATWLASFRVRSTTLASANAGPCALISPSPAKPGVTSLSCGSFQVHNLLTDGSLTCIQFVGVAWDPTTSGCLGELEDAIDKAVVAVDRAAQSASTNAGVAAATVSTQDEMLCSELAKVGPVRQLALYRLMRAASYSVHVVCL